MPRFLEDWEHPASRYAQFYTKPFIAAACYTQLLATGLVPEDAFFIEPSVGAGAFYDLLPAGRRWGCDIDPHPSCPVLKADFLAYPLDEFKGRPCVVVGNPPFGLSRVHGAMPAAFFNRSTVFADLIAFIVPSGYAVSRPNSWFVEFDPSFELVREFQLPTTSFEELNAAIPSPSFGHRCVFQIWRRRSFPCSVRDAA